MSIVFTRKWLNFRWQLLEPITLALGYFGNLSERTSVLAGFALLSITLKFLSVLYLMLTTKVVMLIVIHGTLGAFHLVEAVRSPTLLYLTNINSSKTHTRLLALSFCVRKISAVAFC